MSNNVNFAIDVLLDKRKQFEQNLIAMGIVNATDYIRIWLETLSYCFEHLNEKRPKISDVYFDNILDFGGSILTLSFNITELTQSRNFENSRIPKSFFLNGNISYDHIDAVGPFIPNAPPIMVIDFPFEHDKRIVIDGNHRVSAFVRSRFTHISVNYFYDTEEIAYTLQSRLEQAFYAFILELQQVCQLSKQGVFKIPIEQSLALKFRK